MVLLRIERRDVINARFRNRLRAMKSVLTGHARGHSDIEIRGEQPAALTEKNFQKFLG